MGRTFTKEAQIQELGIKLICLQLKAAEVAHEINGIISGIDGGDSLREHISELGLAND